MHPHREGTLDEARRPWRRRLAPLFLVLAGLGVYFVLGPSILRVHRERQIALELGALAPDITRIEIAWTSQALSAGEPVTTTLWNFDRGTAPSRLEGHARLADGEWVANVEIERFGRPDRTTWSRRVYVEGTQVVLPLREALR